MHLCRTDPFSAKKGDDPFEFYKRGGLRRGAWLEGGLRRGDSQKKLEGELEKGLEGGLEKGLEGGRRGDLEFSKGASRGLPSL